MSKVPRLNDPPTNAGFGWIPTIASGIAGAIVGALATFGTGVLTYWSHQGDVDAKMIEMSVAVLRADPTSATDPLRDWAIEQIEKRANFTFTQAQKQALHKERLPSVAAQIGNAVATANRSLIAP